VADYKKKNGKSYEPEPVNKFSIFLLTFFHLTIFDNRVFFARRPLRPNLRGRGAKNTAGLYSRLAAQTPIRAHQNSGTSNLIRPKVPILSDVISATGGVNISQFPGSFRLSRQPE
jgi:hypothetical protein